MIKVEPPGGDAYRQVMPVAAGVGRLLRPAQPRQALGRARSQVRRRPRGTREARRDRRRRRPQRAAGAGGGVRARLGGAARRAPGARRRHRHLVRPARPARRLPGLRPRRAGALGAPHLARRRAATACRCAPAGSRWPTSPPGTCSPPVCWRRSCGRGRRGRGSSSRCRCSAPRSPCRSRISCGSTARPRAAAAATRGDLAARADEIAGGLAMNPYYRCYEAADGFLAVACLNLAQRQALARALRSRRPDDRAPDLVPDDPAVLADEAASDRGDRASDRSGAGGGLARSPRRGRRAGRPGARARDGARRSAGTRQRPAPGRRAARPRAGDDARRRLPGRRRRPGRDAPAPALGADTEAVLAEVGA